MDLANAASPRGFDEIIAPSAHPPEWYGWMPSVVRKTDGVPAAFPIFLPVFSQDNLKAVLSLDDPRRRHATVSEVEYDSDFVRVLSDPHLFDLA